MSDERAQRYSFIPGPVAFTVSGGQGVYLHTSTGRQILDAAGGAIVANIGHGRPEMVEVCANSVKGMGYVAPLWPTENRLRLLDRILDRWLPSVFTRCFFVSGGSESIDTAMRIARQYQVAKGRTQRCRIAGRSTSYHGATIATLSVANHDRRRRPFGPMLSDHPKIDPLSADQALKDLEAADPATIAAVILEPVIGSSGAGLISEPDYWPKIRKFCTEHDILLIADEVMTAYGRTGSLMGTDDLGVVPDLIAGGKGLGGGYAAIGAVVAQQFVVDPIAAAGDNIMFFTFSGLEASVAIADKVLQILEDEELVERSRTMGEKLRARLETEFRQHPNVADIRGRGLMQGLELVKDRESGTTFNGRLAPLIIREALNRDCWIYPCGSAGVPDGLLFGPAFVVSESEIDQMVSIVAASLDAAVFNLDGEQ